MRKVQLLLVCLMLSVAAFAADKVIKLPKPNLNRTGAVMKALSERHSTREYASKSLSLSDLSDLLWAANGIIMFPRMHATKYDHNNQKSTWWYRNASFLRLKNVEFGYNFDKQMLQKLRMSNIKLFVQGTNLAVWDNIKLWDPELGNSTSGSTYPICGTWTIGLEVTF